MFDKKIAGRKIAILATDGFEESELFEPKKGLENAGAEVLVVSPKDGEIKSWKEKNWGKTCQVDLSLEDAKAEDFDALVLPGGVMNPDTLRMNERAVEFVKGFTENDKIVAAICHGAWTLIETEFLDGRTVTSWPSLKSDLQNAGATWVDREVVVDQYLITSRKPSDLKAFTNQIIEEVAASKNENMLNRERSDQPRI